eukprot:12904153-Prorocentrum_lima.AAC.1
MGLDVNWACGVFHLAHIRVRSLWLGHHTRRKRHLWPVQEYHAGPYGTPFPAVDGKVPEMQHPPMGL